MLSILSSVLQRGMGTATIEFGLIAGLIALTAISMSSAPTLSKAAFLNQQAPHLSTQQDRDSHLWELVTHGN